LGDLRSHGKTAGDLGLPKCDFLSLGEFLQIFQRNIVPLEDGIYSPKDTALLKESSNMCLFVKAKLSGGEFKMLHNSELFLFIHATSCW
jgi:hypothetical protein